jgi:hypothetical protein
VCRICSLKLIGTDCKKKGKYILDELKVSIAADTSVDLSFSV